MTSRRRPVTSHDVTPYTRVLYQAKIDKIQVSNIRKSRFLIWWPWPLTYDLDHWSRSRGDQCQSLYQFSGPYVNSFGCDSANWHTARHTNRTDFITLTADAGGNEWQFIGHALSLAMHCLIDPSCESSWLLCVNEIPSWCCIYTVFPLIEAHLL